MILIVKCWQNGVKTLLLATERGYVDVVSTLTQHGVDINSVDEVKISENLG